MVEVQTKDSSAQVQHNISDINLTAPEIGYLWSSYLAESMSVCMLNYFVAKSKDPDYKPIFELALNTSRMRLQVMENFFSSVNYPLPIAFGEEDVDINAKELYSEPFLLLYTNLMNKFITQNYTQAYCLSTRKDIRDFYLKCTNTARDIHQEASNVLLAKGLLQKPPSVVTPDRADLVRDKDYYGAIWGNKRSLNALEMSYIYDDLNSKLILRTCNMSCLQVVRDENVKKHLYKGKQLSDKHVETLSEILKNDNLPVPKSFDFYITDSKEPPFSDRLMQFHYVVILGYTLLCYGFALTNSTRKDLITTFTRLIAETLLLAKEGTDLMIEYNWLEKPPQSADRQELIH